MSAWDVIDYGAHAVLLRERPRGPRASASDRAGGPGDLAGLADRLRRVSAVREVVPAFGEVLVTWAPGSARGTVLEKLRRVISEPAIADVSRRETVVHVLPVRYDGPDLAAVAAACGITPERVIGLHTAATYVVAAVGFQPGFAYLTGLDPALRLPRRAAPRRRVSPGAVAIAAAYAAVYPHASPGGWHLIGETAEELFSARQPRDGEGHDAGARLRVGDRVRFTPLIRP